MDFDIFVSVDGEIGHPHSDYASLIAALAAYDRLVASGKYKRVTLYHFDTVIKSS